MENRIGRFVVGLFIFFAFYGVVNSFFLSKKKKIYTVALVYDSSGPAKNGTTYFFKYYLKSQEFKGRTKKLFGGTTNSNQLLYIEVLKNDFNAYHVLEFNKVPDCLTMKDVPQEGWTEVPKNPCTK